MSAGKRSPSTKVSLFKKLVCACIDFSAAREATELLIANYEQSEHGDASRAFETGVIVSYARPFGENHGLGSLPKLFRTIDDADAQMVHDRVLDARNILEAHNNLVERGRLITSRDAHDDPLNVQVEVRRDGSAFWNAATPVLRRPELDRLLRMLCIQEERVRAAADLIVKDWLKENGKSAGSYTLEKDFP